METCQIKFHLLFPATPLRFLLVLLFLEIFFTAHVTYGAASAAEMHDTLRVQEYFKKAEEHYQSDPGRAIKDCHQALELSLKINYEAGITNAYGWLAYLFEQQGQVSKALEFYELSLQLARKNKLLNDESTILNNIAAIYKDQGKIDKALKMHSQSLAIKTKLGNKDGMATSYNNIGLIYASLGRIPEALDCYSKALKLEEELKNPEGIATAFINMGSVYRAQKDYGKALEYFRKAWQTNLKTENKYSTAYSLNGIGTIHDELGQTDSALFFYRQAYALRSQIKDEQGIAYASKNIGSVLNRIGQRDSARWYFEKSLKAFESLGDKLGMATVTNRLGEFYLAEKEHGMAEMYLKRSLNLAQQLGYPTEVKDAAGNLQKLYRAAGDYQNALKMYELYVTMRDSVINDNNRKAYLRTQFQYEYDKKTALLKSEQQKKEVVANAEIKKQRILRNAMTGGFAVVILFSLVFYRQRNRISKEKKRSDDLLLNILPAETAEELKQNGFAQARDFDEVTVMFTDFKNFSVIAEQLSAAELVNMIDTYFREFDRIITRYNIEKIKTIGDAYMCAGGLPVVNRTNARDVVEAAIEIMQFMEQQKSSRISENKIPFEIRIGIHTGPVIAGIVGVKKFAYDIWGDTVNIASRMESSGEEGRINISGSTYLLVRDHFTCTYRGKIMAKNKGAIDMYFVETNATTAG